MQALAVPVLAQPSGDSRCSSTEPAACGHPPDPSPGDRSALDLTLRPLRRLLDDPAVTEFCINRPCEAFLERVTGWERVPIPHADAAWCYRLAKLIANSTHQRIDAESPLLSATLPTGERAQLVLPPATTDGCVSITLRRPSTHTWSLEELSLRGTLDSTRIAGTDPDEDPVDATLYELLQARDYFAFLRTAVRARKNILISGATGSGKTTWTKALIGEIPAHERLITIEDARELVLDKHPNHVRLYYSKDAQGLAKVTPKQLLEATLRMKPDRILLAELRGEEAFHYLRNVNSGHPGSITSIHAASCAGALEQLTLLVKESPAGRDLSRADIHALLRQSIDIVIQVGVSQGRRCIREIALTQRLTKSGLRTDPPDALRTC
jgi:type IV secretion system protein VirB11